MSALDDFYDDTSSDGGMSIKPEDEDISLSRALESLTQAKELLQKFRNEDEAWMHPKVLLDRTAAALDEAALALRSDDISDDEKKDEDEDSERLLVRQTAGEVLRGRQAILDKANAVVSARTKSQMMREKSMTKKEETLLVYATHTGTSKEFCLELLNTLGMDRTNIKNMKYLTLADVQERKRVLFICSTFGCGRPPRDGEIFLASLELLNESVNAGQGLYGVEVAVAALGNSKFSSFCVFGKQLSEKLCELRATEILPMRKLDAKGGKEEQKKQFLNWQHEIIELEGIASRDRTKDPQKTGTNKDQMNSCCVIL